MSYELILAAKDIPNESTVYKRGGTTPYILIKEGIVVYGPDKQKQILFEDNYLLTNSRGTTYNVVPPDKYLMVQFNTDKELLDFVKKLEEQNRSHK